MIVGQAKQAMGVPKDQEEKIKSTSAQRFYAEVMERNSGPRNLTWRIQGQETERDCKYICINNLFHRHMSFY